MKKASIRSQVFDSIDARILIDPDYLKNSNEEIANDLIENVLKIDEPHFEQIKAIVRVRRVQINEPDRLTQVPEYISYSGMAQFGSDLDEFCLKYAVLNRPPREPQSHPASVGSAFDAFVKAELYDRYYGVNYKPEFSREALFEKQVEEQNRDFAYEAGEHVLQAYKDSGMYERFTDVFDQVIEPPLFEVRAQGEIEGITLLGYPDGFGRLKNGCVIADWKVNGYCGKGSVSPQKGYGLCLDGFIADKHTRSHGKSHKDYTEAEFCEGITMGEAYMEDYHEKWASQTSGYAWLFGESVGSENFLAMIHQCVAKGMGEGQKPILRFAEFRGKVRKPFQKMLIKRYRKVWDALNSGHIYTKLSREENDTNLVRMNRQAKMFCNDKTGVLRDLTAPNWW